jgi:hypothetical protein
VRNIERRLTAVEHMWAVGKKGAPTAAAVVAALAGICAAHTTKVA